MTPFLTIQYLKFTSKQKGVHEDCNTQNETSFLFKFLEKKIKKKQIIIFLIGEKQIIIERMKLIHTREEY